MPSWTATSPGGRRAQPSKRPTAHGGAPRRAGRTVAFDDYFAALDREEHAAREYRRLVELAEAA
jgi:hypothetical protein